MHAPLTPDTDALPFLVVNGGWFWIVLMVAFALAIAGIVTVTRHVIAIVRARGVVARQRAAVVHTLAEGEVVVAGRWHRDSITVGDEKVELGEDRRIVLPSRGIQIDDDANVIVRGELARVAVSQPEASGYRENAGIWRIGAAEVYATKPRARAHPLPWAARLVGIFLAVVGSYATLRIIGNQLVERVADRDYRRGDGHPLYVDELDAVSIAASLPGSREKALQELAEAFEQHPYRDDQSVRRQLALDRIIHGTCGYLPILRARPDEQLAMARRCHYDRAVFDILVSIGEYEEAWKSRPPNLGRPDQEGMVAIAIGDWTAAALQAEKMAAWNANETPRNADMRAFHIAAALRYRCLSQWFRTLAGDVRGAEKLRELAAAPGGDAVVCAPMLAQTLPADQRAAYLRDALATVPQDAFHVRSARFLASIALWLAGEDNGITRRAPFDVSSPLADGRLTLRAWLAQFGVERWREANDSRQYALALAGVVLREVHRGDFTAARRAAEEANVAAGALEDAYPRETARTLLTFIALREGQRELPAPGNVDTYLDALKVRRGGLPEYGLRGYPAECDEALTSALSTAQRGDGRPLAKAMQACSVHATSALPNLIGVLPLVSQGRSELATALRWWIDGFGVGSYEPFSSVAYAAARRDIARFVGDDESAERWGQMAKRFLAPLEDPTRTLALILWHE